LPRNLEMIALRGGTYREERAHRDDASLAPSKSARRALSLHKVLTFVTFREGAFYLNCRRLKGSTPVAGYNGYCKYTLYAHQSHTCWSGALKGVVAGVILSKRGGSVLNVS